MASIDLVQLLEVCVRATLAAQRYVMVDLVKLPEVESRMSFHRNPPNASAPPQTVLDLSTEDREMLLTTLRRAVDVAVKSHFEYKENDAAEDLVTTADVLTQAVFTSVLQRTFPSQPFTVIGEEEEPSSAIAAEADICINKHYNSGFSALPYGAELRAHLQRYAKVEASSGRMTSTLHADSDEALRRRVGIFIDPIDGTNCFFHGVWQAPMTLVGITLDGLPIAAVVNRVFYYPLGGDARATSGDPSTAGHTGCMPSLSYIFNPPGLASPFLVFDGALLPAPVTIASHPPFTPTSDLLVCRSSTTKEEFLQQLVGQLQPCTPVCARGAGYKQYHLLKQMWTGRALPSEEVVPASVFVSPPMTIMKWDCCAPHAFLYAMGGDIFAHDGTPLRYTLVRPDGSLGTHAELAALPKGLLAVTPYAREEVVRRMKWTTRNA
ncbi:hypothetical protein ABL78_5228 [Leptomonas seymouri]|uniref:Inositol polyphosphate 1-phosphatase n=1 Tax=Leptomonas seymouri TaxID=5684 RepID=A0A0N0P4U3_LEPSE|nr:hypothetical protein ABL78_5228 [Leptomonas seymouri]|eukprot:KPI85696.1 hypothetical protein ABL78_5228 [Leptomonas seymouri]